MSSIYKDVAQDFATGQGTAGTSPAALSATHAASRGVTIIPASGNAGTIYAGIAGVTTSDGVVVPSAGLTIPVEDPANIYLIASASGQDYSYVIV